MTNELDMITPYCIHILIATMFELNDMENMETIEN